MGSCDEKISLEIIFKIYMNFVGEANKNRTENHLEIVSCKYVNSQEELCVWRS